FVADLDFDDLPDAAVEAAELHLLDTLGVAAPGGQADGIEILLTQLGAWGGRPEAHVLGSDLRLPAPWAVLANGAMIHAKEFEDVHAGAFVRPSGSVVPCALAAAELRGGVTGAELLTAMVAGYELICRVGRVVQRPIS